MGLIEVKNLWYTYPHSEEPALRDISLTIDPGEFILLTGPSGCGKTTFCRCLNGLVPRFYNGVMEGTVEVAGLDTRENPTMRLAEHVGLIFQNPDNQIFALTVEKDIAFGLENQGVPKDLMVKDIQWAAETTGIQQLRQRATHELSGGQKQRLTIASVLAMKPKIIVMDEPTAFLDPVGAEHIFSVLDYLNKELGITIILIEHRMDLAVKHVDRIIVFNDGGVMHDGKPAAVLSDDSTRLLGVGIPRVFELARRLNSRGIRFNSLPISALQFYEMFKDRLTNKTPQMNPELNDLTEFTGEFHHQPVIDARNLNFSYPGGVNALKDLSLTIHHGDYVAIMGENGAGKTTLVKHFNGLLKPSSGSVTVDGVDVSTLSVAQLSRKVGLVFQNPDDQLFEETVEKEISFALRNFGFKESVIEQRVTWALNLLDIEQYREKSPFTLSGGERKRVALASVLAWDPEILVLDEPTIGQDYGQKEKLRHFLVQLRSQGKTVVIVTHDVEFVAESQPKIVLMADGQVISEGPAKQVMTDPDTLHRCSVSQPEITRLFAKLSDHGMPRDVLDIDEAFDILSRNLKEAPR
ncbi:ATP-binding cassette domain-containing protein [Candidatus Bathyarchaeota archaeon]|nr:ATP-binding cassette domain-containing protein [Candidatus Bathyarchaeota archaeon]